MYTALKLGLQGEPKKTGPQTRDHNSVKSQPIYIFHYKIVNLQLNGY